jgi:hypothetical protein
LPAVCAYGLAVCNLDIASGNRNADLGMVVADQRSPQIYTLWSETDIQVASASFGSASLRTPARGVQAP